jgi:hypothetical protein
MENGFKFSSSKTVGMHFCNKRGLHPDPELKLYNSPIKIVSETKLLGLLFDSKLAFQPHIKMLKNKSLKGLNILKCVSSTDWGADSAVLLMMGCDKAVFRPNVELYKICPNIKAYTSTLL